MVLDQKTEWDILPPESEVWVMRLVGISSRLLSNPSSQILSECLFSSVCSKCSEQAALAQQHTHTFKRRHVGAFETYRSTGLTALLCSDQAAADWAFRESRLDSSQGQEILSSPQCLDGLWSPPSLQFSRYRGALSQGVKHRERGEKGATSVHLMSR